MTSRTPSLDVRLGLLLFVAIGAALLSGCGGQRANQGAKHPAVGQPLVFLDLAPLTGDGVPLTQAALPGRVTLMNFWATWCGPCRVEFPRMAAMTKKLSADPKFQYLSVNMDGAAPADTREIVEKFLTENQANHPTWTDSAGITSKGLAEQISWPGTIPMTVVIDSQGTIRGIWNGYVRGDEVAMEALVKELLNAK